MPDGTRIDINRVKGSVVFTQVTVTRSQVVFWKNNDPDAPHWPIQGPRFQIGPNGNSDDSTVYPAPLPTTIYYGCAITGHENERGSIVVYDDFLPSQIKNNVLPNGTKGAVYADQNLATGGMSPYTFTTSGSVPPGLTVAANTAANTGIKIGGTPTQAGTFSFTLNATDNLQNNVQQTFTITIS
jgi:hypothetical protein